MTRLSLTALVHLLKTRLLPEDEIVGESIILVVKGTNKALSVKDTYSGTPIMAVTMDSSSDSQKWFLV